MSQTKILKISFINQLLSKLIFSLVVFNIGCASLQQKDEPSLLLEEIKKEQTLKGVEVDTNDLWENSKIEKRWVPAQFRGNRVYVEGHYEYVVVTPGRWKTK